MKKYKDVLGRVGTIVRHGEEEYVIIRFKDKQIALFECDIEGEIRQFRKEHRYFVNLKTPYMGHAMRLLTRGQKHKEAWLWKPIEYICEFDVIYDY